MNKHDITEKELTKKELIDKGVKLYNSSSRIHNQYLKEHIVFVNQSRIHMKTDNKSVICVDRKAEK